MTGIGIGIGLCFPAPYIASGFSILDLIGDSDDAVIFDPSDLTTLWDDVAKTIQHDGDEDDPIRAATDASGKGHDWVTIHEDLGTPRYGSGPGFKDHSLADVSEGNGRHAGLKSDFVVTGSQSRSVFLRVKFDSIASTLNIMAHCQGGTNPQSLMIVSGQLRYYSQSTSFLTGMVPTLNTDYVVGFVQDGTTLGDTTVYLNTDTYSPVSATTVNTSGGEFFIGTNTVIGNAADRVGYGFAINRALNATEVSNLIAAMQAMPAL